MSHYHVESAAAVAAIMGALDEALAEGNIRRAKEKLKHLEDALDTVLRFGYSEMALVLGDPAGDSVD